MLRLLLRFMFFNTLLRRLKIKRSEGNGEIMNKLQGAFRSKLDADKKKNFADLDKTVKAERIAQNVQDPKSGDNTGYNKLVLRNTEENSTGWSWKTQEQIADMLKAQDLVCSDDLVQRGHEYSSLARAGVKLYYVHESLFTETTSKVDVAGTSSMCDLQADHSTMVTSDMRACTIGLHFVVLTAFRCAAFRCAYWYL